MNKNLIKNIIKICVAFGLIYWLVQSGKLDFALLGELIKSPLLIIVTFSILQFDNLLVAIRLRMLLHQKTVKSLSMLRMFMANWIGLFFNSVLPGAVTGDLVKIFYIQNLDSNLSKKYLLLSVFIDRIVGLMGLIMVGGIVSILNYQQLSMLSADVKTITHINLLLLSGVLVTISLLFILPQFPLQISALVKNMTGNISIIKRVLDPLEKIWNDLCQFRKRILLYIGLSMIVQGLAMFAFWYLVSPFAQGELSLTTVFSIMPMGFIGIAIPIAPAGLGVGHVIFQTLLEYFKVTNGASLFNIYFFIVMFSNLTGVIPYLLHPSKNKQKTSIGNSELEGENS